MNIALIGYGKMGKTIEQVALSRGHNIPIKIDLENISDFNAESFSTIDVAIEFTSPHTALNNILKCIEIATPVVCGTTGWLSALDEVEEKVIEFNGSFLYASNFSVGVNIFFEINKKLAQLMNGMNQYDITIKEIHHTQKKDAPSGTAITLAEQVIENHEVKYSSEVDEITIVHNAHNRNGFALGAVMAAEFIHNKKGIFTMKDVLGFGN
jgi:4-hydroxy-tetrahydrodipicolinate reductase